MNILVIGRGGREHSIVQKIAKSPLVKKIYVAPGNAGMTEAEQVPLPETDPQALVGFAKENEVDWTIVGPEVPLLEGVVDVFMSEGLKVFGPTMEAALIEGSKAFAKEVMTQNNIPTASYEVFSEVELALNYLHDVTYPVVIKANGLAAGKGVVIAENEQVAQEAIIRMLGGEAFGEAGKTIVVEEFLDGNEFSLMAFVDGERVYPMVPAQDYKRAFDGHKGPNTGGMGAYAPSENISSIDVERAIDLILKPTAKALVHMNRPFTGVLYAGCIMTNQGPKVIEFNARFGDPETQVVLPLLENDLMQVICDLGKGQDPQLKWKEASCAGVVVASAGYPNEYEKGHPVPKIQEGRDVFSIYAGVKRPHQQVVSDGGRVMLVGSVQPMLKDAIEEVYQALTPVSDPNFFYRRDIAQVSPMSFSSEYK